MSHCPASRANGRIVRFNRNGATCGHCGAYFLGAQMPKHPVNGQPMLPEHTMAQPLAATILATGPL